MLALISVLNYVKNGVAKKDPRFTVIDDEHIMDTKTGIEFHIYDDYFQMTHGDDVVGKPNYFTKQEQATVWEIKQLITDPAKASARKEAYPAMIGSKREYLSSLFESPMPMNTGLPKAEVGAREYAG